MKAFTINQIKKNLNSIYLLPFLLLLSTVFVVNPELKNGVVTGKYFWFYASMGLVAITTIFSLFKSSQKWHVCLLDWLILAFGIITLSVSYGLNDSEVVTKHILLLLIIILYFYFKVFLSSFRSMTYWMVLFVMFTGMVEAYWGLKQLYGFSYSQHSMFKLTGSFFNPGPYACFLAVILPIAFYYILRDWNCSHVKFQLRYWQIYLRWGVSLVTYTMIAVVLPAAMSRASWLAAIGGCGVVAIYYIARNGKLQNYYFAHKKRAVLGLLLSICLLFTGMAGMYYLKKDSADGRVLIWKNSIQLILDHPQGVGIGNFSGSYGNQQAAYFEAGKGTEQEEYVAGNPEYGFNEYLQIGIEQGIIPFLLFIGILINSIYVGMKRKKIAPTASLVALLIVSGMSYPFSILPFLILLAFLLAWISAGEKGYKIGKKQILLMEVGGFLLVAGCLYNRYPTYEAYKKWQKKTHLYSVNLYEDATQQYKTLYPLLSDQLPFLFEYAQSLSKTERFEESNQVLSKAIRISCDPMLYNIMGKNYQALQEYSKAEECFLQAAHIVPHRIYPYYLLTNLYVEIGDMDKAKQYATIVLYKDPKVESTAIREMRDNVKKAVF